MGERSVAMMEVLLAFVILALTQNGQQTKHAQSDEIDDDELSEYLAKQNECQPDQIYFWNIDQYDFLGKGYNQAVVVGSTCMTGTAGPDVHSVFTRDEHGELKELAMEEPKFAHRVLFGNANSAFRIENGLLVDVYRDTSDRDDPVVLKYKWDKAKEQFVIVSMKLPPIYKTSYDCGKAEKVEDEAGIAICYVESLADLDVELAQIYKSYLSGLSAEERKAAVEEQREWLKKRNKECVIYKGWVDCLEESYKGRIAELKRKIETRTKNGGAGPSGGR
jgi:uncharacterized protein YecT (DUF1311 family)